MLNFFRRKPQDPRLQNPLWRYYYEQFQQAGEPFTNTDVLSMIVDSFVVYNQGKIAERYCLEGFQEYGRGMVLSTPLIDTRDRRRRTDGDSMSCHRMYVPRDSVNELMPWLPSEMLPLFLEDTENYNPYKEYISAVALVFGDDFTIERAGGPLDLVGWIVVPSYVHYFPPNPPDFFNPY